MDQAPAGVCRARSVIQSRRNPHIPADPDMSHWSARKASPVAHAAPRVSSIVKETSMSKRARKRRDRKKNAANHGKKPNT
ncbi:hypothetical protein GTS_29020 [Gandjariella thermophila]|uniref:Uncharacterized protein n=1 Tax=Gandjariella thermophila TaxID=1931992 RepID=A0A4D4JA31_9PSEU|nr:hypothetical protein [Gandjariella thermophila]GDY31269.1 hypothetical protein GTS_29020 [Gandjariella thermophila]